MDISTRELALDGLFLWKDDSRSMNRTSKIEYPKIRDMLDYISKQQPKLRDSSQTREELLFPLNMFMVMIKFLLEAFEADFQQLDSVGGTSEFQSSVDTLCMLLERGLAFEGSLELHATASKALISVAFNMPEASLKAATQTQGVRNVEVTSLRLEAVRYWAFDNGKHYDSCSEESDSTDSNYQVFGYYSLASTISCGGASLLNSDAESSPRGNTLDVENFYLSQSYQSGDQDEEIDWRSHGSYGILEAKGSLDALNLLNDSNQFANTLSGGMLSPSGLDCQINARILSGNKEAIKRTLSYCGPQSDEYVALNRRENEFVYNLHREATFHEPHSIYKTTTSQLGRIASEEVEVGLSIGQDKPEARLNPNR